MKINGVEVKGPSEEVLVLPRATGEDIPFIARAILDYDEFEKRVPEPKPKAVLVKGGWKENVDDPAFKEAVEKRDDLRIAWLVLKSLEPSNIEWDTIDMDKPSTWLNWQDELRDAGLNTTEIGRVITCVTTANALNEEKLEAARESFLAGLAKASKEKPGHRTGPDSTQSGTPVPA
jgi:hypothetical protein